MSKNTKMVFYCCIERVELGRIDSRSKLHCVDEGSRSER